MEEVASLRMPARRGQFFVAVGFILLGLMGLLFAASSRSFKPTVTGSAAHVEVVNGEVRRAVLSALANASNTQDITSSFNGILLKRFLDEVVASEQGTFITAQSPSALKGNGTVTAQVQVNIAVSGALNWTTSMQLNLVQQLVSLTVAAGSTPQFETVTLTVRLSLNGEPDGWLRSSLITKEGQNLTCTLAAKYSDGTLVLQAQVPAGWSEAQLVTFDINGIKVSTSLKHP